jgi:uncharacterized protein YbjT (DUF2867 family)
MKGRWCKAQGLGTMYSHGDDMSDLHGKLVTIFGGGGFVGRHAAQALMAAGARVRIAQREPKSAMRVKALGSLGQTQFVAADITRPETLRAAVAGADAVINLVGSFGNYDAVQVRGAANVAQAAADAGAAMLVHVSAIGADAESPSHYGRSKGEGEAAVRAAFPGAIILRPSIIFGREDQFINRFAGMMRMLPIMPVIRGGAKFQPVFVGDVAKAIAASVVNWSVHSGQTFELGGPQVMSMRGVYDWIAAKTGRSPLFIDVPDAAAAGMARLTGWLPGAPMTWDQWLMLQSDNVVMDAASDLVALGIAATPIDSVAADGWMDQYRRHGRFGAKTSA